ncbi:SURF1 family protein [Noviherbaspirillum sedimenti]|uniref:SURF1-like protein n=1 Tax=Noviherbaspirillum sedimenti TaxID=2320865 RepID=A0A3A3FZY0_9BURK|nr:SURF1 family protein [Noviherbaspirillum sedimenti]RJG00945.1 SURF1 family protein [Noviherbaspirillum sedimenti]
MTKPAGQGGASSGEATPRSHSLAALVTLAVCAALAFTGFVALGTWQVQRLQWKTALIERVEQRIHADPVAAPGPQRWPQMTALSDEYRRVSITGSFLHELTTLVQASTTLGAGYWVMTPLRSADGSSADGSIVLINRGFIPAGPAGRIAAPAAATNAAPAAQAAPAVTVTGLLRMSQPGGGFLRQNDPLNKRWYSRDVEAIATASKLSRVAPYFVDADAASASAHAAPGESAADRPIGGLTVVSFPNNHLVYALTWYALALMTAAAAFWVAREERRTRRAAGEAGRRRDQDSENGRTD